MKITMFFCAGNLSEELGVREIEDMRGVGRRMPVTMAAFTVAALGTIGVPPMAGFITKWYLGAGAIESREYWVLGVLIASSLLNAAYFLPVLYRAWFAAPALAFPSRPGRLEIRPTLLLPTVAGALASIAVGALAAVPLSPLGWARIVAARELGP
jgi:multicomponent Na+:H+ antiporter subunit D